MCRNCDLLHYNVVLYMVSNKKPLALDCMRRYVAECRVIV